MDMQISVTATAPSELAAQMPIAVFVNKTPSALPGWVKSLPAELYSAIEGRWNQGNFDGESGRTAVVYAPGGCAAILVGLGQKRRLDQDALKRAYAALISTARAEKFQHVAAPLMRGPDAAASAESAAVGAVLANYLFSSYRSDTSKLTPQTESLSLWEPKAADRRKAARGVEAGKALAEATCRVRDLVNTPANDLTPKNYAALASGFFKEAGVKVKVLDPDAIAKLGMRAVLTVGGGSANDPRFLVATYTGRPRQPKAVDVVLVGKGVTFDSGGISIKPSADMWEMRGDMMGSAVVISALCAAAKLKLPLNVVCLTPLVENMPSAAAYRPGDVIRTKSGQTIEIISTDAEGRLILADALTYAQEFNPKVIVDCATLTGACAVALGDVCCGVFTDHDKHWRALDKAGKATGEWAWRLPMFEEYDQLISSDVADMKNSGGRYGGASTAARLLRKFTGDFPWIHIDIAGIDLDKKGHAWCPRGASGFGARLIVEYLRGLK